jgi:hypothetical protein
MQFPIRIFIGFDPREAVAYSVLSYSIISRASQPVSITPLVLQHLQGILTRERDPLQSTDFSFSRFLVPYLCNYEGWAIFMDCDMLVRKDIGQLWDCRDPGYAAMVVQHDYQPAETTKFLGQVQTKYKMKNWSSVILFNNARCRSLTPEYVNNASGLELHQFKWLESEELIGSLPPSWNHLVGYNQNNEDVANAHFTMGGPYFKEYSNCEFADEWKEEREQMLHVSELSGCLTNSR